MDPKICHRCGLDIAEAEDFYQVDVCNHCGWVLTPNQLNAEKSSSRFSLTGLVGVVLLMAAIISHTANWGQFSIEVLPPQSKDYAGVATFNDYSLMAEMCGSLKRYECMEDMLLQKVEANPDHLEALSDLGVLQFQRRNFAGSIKNLKRYVESGGRDVYANYTYAKALSETGQIDLAAQHYRKILAKKPGTLQVTVAKSYVDMLVKNGRKKQAHEVIASIRKKGANTTNFMKEEMREPASSKKRI